MDSRNFISLRLGGILPPTDALTKMLGLIPTVARQRGTTGGIGLRKAQEKIVWKSDFWSHIFARWEGDKTTEVTLKDVAIQLEKLSIPLSSIDRNVCKIQLYFSTIRVNEQGSFIFPSTFIQAAAKCDLEVKHSLLVILEDTNETEANQEKED